MFAHVRPSCFPLHEEAECVGDAQSLAAGAWAIIELMSGGSCVKVFV
jgi:hypothetical protein